MNEVTATAVCDMFDAQQENNTITLKKKLVRVVQHLITACPVRKRATLETLPTTQIIYRNTSSEKRRAEKFDLPVSKSLRAAQEITPKRRSAEVTVQESIV